MGSETRPTGGCSAIDTPIWIGRLPSAGLKIAPASRHSARRGETPDSRPEGVRNQPANIVVVGLHRLGIGGPLAELHHVARLQAAAFDCTSAFGDATGKRAAHRVDAGSRRGVPELL